MPPSHAGTCACATILLHFTLHAELTDYIRGADDLLRTTPYLVSQLQLFRQMNAAVAMTKIINKTEIVSATMFTV